MGFTAQDLAFWTSHAVELHIIQKGAKELVVPNFNKQ
jgi:hypothetical protein